MNGWGLQKMNNWVLLAIAAMFLFSVSNSLLKVASDKYDLGKAFYSILPAIIAAVVVFLLALFYLFSTGKLAVSQELAILAGGGVVFSLIGIVMFLGSLKTGKVAEVTGILSLSTIVVALISSHFFSVDFSLREIAAMVMAVASILLFVI